MLNDEISTACSYKSKYWRLFPKSGVVNKPQTEACKTQKTPWAGLRDDLGTHTQAKPQEILRPRLFRGLFHKDFSACVWKHKGNSKQQARGSHLPSPAEQGG